MAETIVASKRESRGKRNARRQRAAGSIPAILYGHGEETVSLSIDAAKIASAIRHGSQLVELTGDVTQNALIREIQWDTFGHDILHIDFTRVSAGERIETVVAVELRGIAPGTNMGGIVDHPTYQVDIECPAMSIPEKLQVTINSLELGDSITASMIELPSGVKMLTDPDTMIVQCIEPAPELEEDSLEAGSVEPEVIGQKDTEDEEGAGS